jgi:hypothetical protein
VTTFVLKAATTIVVATYVCTVLIAYDCFAKPLVARIADPGDGRFVRISASVLYALTWPLAVAFWVLDASMRRALRVRTR